MKISFGMIFQLIRKHPVISGIGAAGVVAGCVLSLLFAGYEISHRELPTNKFWWKVDRKIQHTFFGGLPVKLGDTTYNSALILLDSHVDPVELDVERPKQETNLMSFSGGGMTSFGNDLLLLPYDGIIYKARPDMSAQRTAIRAPDTHRDEFRALSETEAYKDYHFDLYYIRYNDLKYFEAGDQRGLLASYTEYHSDGECATNTLARLDFASSATTIDDVTAEPNDWEIVYRSSPCLKLKKRLSALEAHMAGGRMAITGPETVYLTNGDYHMDGMRSDGHGIAQDPENELGKVMRINYLTGESQIVSMGHRNMQGIAALPNGDVYVAEHGPQGGDELNLIREGANYGWPKESYGLTYSSGKLPESDSFGRHDTYTPPEFSWLPSPAISSMIYIKPSFHDAWTGDLLIGSLITESLWRVRFANGKPVYSEQIPIGSRIRSLWQHSNGQIVLWTDNHELIWLTARDIGGYAPVLDEYVKWHGISPATANRLAASVERCAECHSFQMAANSRSPSLARIYGERIASSSYAGYSDALRTKGGRWTDENLADFLTDPQSFSPGTTMPNVMEGDRATAEDVVKFLKYYNDKF